MQFLKTVFWGLVALVLVVVGLGNRQIVPVRVLPEELKAWLGMAPFLEVPLFLVILTGVAVGLVIGLIWEWIREIPERAHARWASREIERLRAELARQKAAALPKDDVLAAVELPAIPARR